MFRSVMKKTSDFLGATVELADTVMFGAFAAGIVPKQLFKPVVSLIGAARLTKPFGEADPTKQKISYAGYVPGASAVVAGWFLEGEVAAGVFTFALSSGFILFAAEVGYKYYKNRKLEREDFVEIGINTAKTTGMIITLTLGGVGKFFTLVENGEAIYLGHKIAASVATGLSAFNAIKGYTMFGKSVCCPGETEDSKPGLQQNYLSLADKDAIQMRLLEEGRSTARPA